MKCPGIENIFYEENKMDKYRRMTDTPRGFALRAGLRAGLDCTHEDKGRWIRYFCGNAVSNIYKDDKSWNCSLANGQGNYRFGTGDVSMKKSIAYFNGVSPDEVNLG
jgi:hypothetical protein